MDDPTGGPTAWHAPGIIGFLVMIWQRFVERPKNEKEVDALNARVESLASNAQTKAEALIDKQELRQDLQNMEVRLGNQITGLTNAIINGKNGSNGK